MDQRPPEGEEAPRLSSDRAALVDPTVHWKKITDKTPIGTKLQLIRREAGSAVYGSLTRGNTWFTHYCELPVFAPDDKD
jgi:hypothetical protein